MAPILRAVLLCLYLLNFSQAEFLLSIRPNRIELGITEDVALECRFRGVPAANEFGSISRLRILKEDIFFFNDIVAEVKEGELDAHNIGFGHNANVTGHISDVVSSYLTVSWTLASEDILGVYRCDIIGFKANLDVLVEKTPIVNLVAVPVTIQDALDLAVREKADFQRRINSQKSYCDSRVAELQAKLQVSVKDVELTQNKTSSSVQANFLTHIADLTDNVEKLKDTGVFQFWPEGTYALLSPNSGCPNSFGASWSSGYRRSHTETIDRNNDQISPASHLLAPTVERVNIDNFFYLHFCVSSVRSPGPEWPRGSYCINQQGVCPSGFNSGSIFWQDEVTNSKATVSGAVPLGNYEANSTRIYYCCRNDGSPQTAVYLPLSRPFYLYRYNGTCQEVIGMKLSEEFMVLDTDNANADSYENSFHPDGSINNVRIQLCYYTSQ